MVKIIKQWISMQEMEKKIVDFDVHCSVNVQEKKRESQSHLYPWIFQVQAYAYISELQQQRVRIDYV